jgi:hypothetical protein
MRAAVVVVGLVAVLAAGCAAADQSNNPGMMGGSADEGYHFSRLTCSAPPNSAGRVVTVILADMGMTQMMGGPAPAGAA